MKRRNLKAVANHISTVRRVRGVRVDREAILKEVADHIRAREFTPEEGELLITLVKQRIRCASIRETHQEQMLRSQCAAYKAICRAFLIIDELLEKASSSKIRQKSKKQKGNLSSK